MQFVNISMNSFIDITRCIAILPTKDKMAKTLVKIAKDEGKLIMPTFRGKRRSVLLLDTGHVIVAQFKPKTIIKWAESKRNTVNQAPLNTTGGRTAKDETTAEQNSV